MVFNRPIPVNRLVGAIADSEYSLPTARLVSHLPLPEAQVNTQEYGRRPYGVGFLVIGHDQTGPHLYEFSPSGNSYEYYAMSIGARSQSAKTYLEKHYESFMDCARALSAAPPSLTRAHAGSLEELITHGLHALRETLQQDKEITIANTSIGIVGPVGAHDGGSAAAAAGSFRILETDPIAPYLKTMTPKETGATGAGAGAADAPATQGTAPTEAQPAAATGPAGGPGPGTDEDVRMEE
jgi:20S proteasome subunit alpha 6